MEYNYTAHINDKTKEIQTVKQHSEAVARLCKEYAIPILKDFAYITGLAHDIGKYQKSFGERINGAKIRVEHSSCGGLVVQKQYNRSTISLMMAYCIVGHHTGLPDGGYNNDTPDMSTLSGRLKRKFEDYSIYQQELCFPETNTGSLEKFLAQDCDQKISILIDKFAFFTRYMFSCLVDADTKDTADFYREEEAPRQLKANFDACLTMINEKLSSYQCRTELQQARAVLQNQAFENSHRNAEIYLLNMPTGSGKTLASIKIALEKVIDSGKKRIIYIIPYNSIIDQTAEICEELFGDELEILRHQSTFSYEESEDINEDYREAAKSRIENWDAPFIITTAVQFFESIYSNKRGKLRKLHNMSESVLIFDEAHLMPRDYLQPCLQSISYITKYLNSEAIFLTATMPDFSTLIKKYALPSSQIINLIEDTSLFPVFQKCRYNYVGRLTTSEILHRSKQYPSSLIIVNTRASARKIFNECSGIKYHLSTYMTSFDRKRVLNEIRQELFRLEEDYPDMTDVPEDRKITVVSTSLIEAGVDLDVYTVFRELSGLDNILQSGGRCNREGKRPSADVFIFEHDDETRRVSTDIKKSLTRGLLDKYSDISDKECISEYYERLFYMYSEDIQKFSIHNRCSNILSIPFKTYAEDFEIIDSKTLSLVVPRDEKSRNILEELKYSQGGNPRELQNYMCTVYLRELNDLIQQNVVEDFGTGIYCLTNPSYYDDQLGITFEATDYYL